MNTEPSGDYDANREAREAIFWDGAASELSDQALHTDVVLLPPDQRRLRLLGELVGKKVLDVGCGTGLWSTLLAKSGAETWGIDISPESVRVTMRRAELAEIGTKVHAAVMSATAMVFEDGFFDAVHGQDIIHHVDAADFGREIARVLRVGGRAVFSENSANNRILMFFRNKLCGHLGIPKWSSDDEYPLTEGRLEEFGKAFTKMRVEYPEFRFFHYLDAKVFGYRNKCVNLLCRKLDGAIYKFAPFLRRYSYRQLIYCER